MIATRESLVSISHFRFDSVFYNKKASVPTEAFSILYFAKCSIPSYRKLIRLKDP